LGLLCGFNLGISPVFVGRIISSLHKSGYDEILLRFKDESIMKTIQTKIESVFLGYEIMDQGSDFCIIRSISSGMEAEFDNILRRAFLVTKTFAGNVLENIKKGNFKQLEEAILLEKTNNKLTNFCERLINKKGFHKKSTFMYLIVWQLEKIADDYKYICNYLTENNVKKLDHEVVELLEKANVFYSSFYELFYDYSTELLNRIDREKKELTKMTQGLMKEKRGHNAVVARYLTSLVEKIFDLSGPMLGIIY